ncbi:hypothetical protein PR202_gb28297 [Eleusine coracana subsp. coracana]|uniref:TFIIS N-terminal domain-containing protein n=1 Tax=Eleusine coracana subsp. coracana TaxID=191504 RepID=A0AAV5FXA7_ELECO|nr:hypothetical protein PR202_gb28297 [Eleusine coracana subsp. coracana]
MATINRPVPSLLAHLFIRSLRNSSSPQFIRSLRNSSSSRVPGCAAAMSSQSQSPLRRWKRFFSTFDTIDAAIVASKRKEEVGCAEELRQAKGDVVQLLCDAPEDDPAEEFFQILDDVMVEYLVTLKTVPVTPTALASTDLAMAVGFLLEEHESEQIRGLASEIVGMWRASVERDLAVARGRVEELRKLSDEILVTKASSTTKTAIRSSNLVETKAPKSTVPAKVSAPLPKKIAPVACPVRASTAVNMDKKMVPKKKMPAIVGNGSRDRAGIDKMEATKRMLRAGYQEAEDAKRQRKIVVIEAPKMVTKQQQPPPRKVVEQRLRPVKMPAPLPKTSAPMAGVCRASMATVDKMPAMDKMMEATKRKLQAGYQEAADAKRQRKIVVIEAPKMAEQKRRSQARCGASMAARRSLMSSSFCRV